MAIRTPFFAGEVFLWDANPKPKASFSVPGLPRKPLIKRGWCDVVETRQSIAGLVSPRLGRFSAMLLTADGGQNFP